MLTSGYVFTGWMPQIVPGGSPRLSTRLRLFTVDRVFLPASIGPELKSNSSEGEPKWSAQKTPREVCRLLAGMEVPFATVIAEYGRELKSNEAVRRQKPAVLVFYRGSWCPHCNRQLGQLRDSYTEDLRVAAFEMEQVELHECARRDSRRAARLCDHHCLETLAESVF